MDLATLLVIAVGLAMDAFAVAVATGALLKREHMRHAVRMAVFFGLFQSVMPCLGWLGGINLRSLIHAADHWVAFGLLAFIGGKMIYEAFQLEQDEQNRRDGEHATLTLLLLSVATSIDALAVGLSFAFLGVEIALPALVIGAVAFAFTLAGVLLGSRVGHWFERRIEIVGGLILIAIGIKIVVEHICRQV